jgi:uncharacterized membrane protein
VIGTILRLLLTGFTQANLAHRIGERAQRYRRAAVMLAVAGVLAVIALGVLAGVCWIALSRRMDAEYAGLIVAGVLILLGVIAGLVGVNMAKRQKISAAASDNPLAAIAKALPDIVAAIKPHMTEIITTAVVLGLLSGRRRKRKDSDD